jgi:hypothetical protein
MHNLRHFYYQNKEKIWKVVLFIAFLLGIIYFLNRNVGEDSNKNLYTSNSSNTNYMDEQNKTYISDKSAISGGTVKQEEVKQVNNTISRFLQYCKSGEAEQAYNMLSNNCKENGYNTLDKFKEKYIKSKFDKDSIYEIEKWIDRTYKISISKDILATGNVNDNTKITEYITIVTENSEEKININSYIGEEVINKGTTQNNVRITALSKKIYMDYEIYDFKIENLSNKTIKIDTLQKIGTLHLEDKNGNKYNAHAHEILEQDLEINSKQQLNISIKYANTYSSNRKIKKIVFKNVILDYVKYKAVDNIEKFEDICELAINL